MSRRRPEDRQLFLFGELNDERAATICEALLAEPEGEWTLFINSDGGSSFGALALVNLLKAHGRVDTVCLGVAMSGAADVLAAGRRRSIVPNAICMVHQVSWDLGQEFAANLMKNAAFLERLNQQMTAMLARDTGRSIAQLEADTVHDFYLFGQEILDYGLADGYFDLGRLPRPRRPRRPLSAGPQPVRGR